MEKMETVEEKAVEKTEVEAVQPPAQQTEVAGPDWSKLGPELQAKLDALSEDFVAYKASVQFGVTDWDHFEVIKWQFQKSGLEGDISNWMSAMVSGQAPIPKVVQPFLQKKAEREDLPVVQAPKIVPPTSPGGSNIVQKISSQALAEARRKAVLGDPTDLRALLGRK
jgi:hypothetical protein